MGTIMQRTVLGGLAVLSLLIAGSLSAVNAADVPVKALTYKAPPVQAPVDSWTGLYVGGDVGVGWMHAPTYTFADPGNAAFNSCVPCITPYDSRMLSGSSESAALGGIHLGYDKQVAPTWLVGVVGDFTWTHINQSVNSALTSLPAVPVVLGSNLSFQTDVKWLASIRARGGFIMQDNWLIFATGGVAWADTNFAANATCPRSVGDCTFLGTTAPFALNATRTGFVVGGGLEWQTPANPWRINLEYLIYGFGSTDSGSSLFNTTIPGVGPSPCVVTPTCSANYSFGKMSIQTLRIGLSYAFH
jgi:outer membrane immunogenic protein